MLDHSQQEAINARVYASPDIVASYARKTSIGPAEASALVRHADAFVHKRVLELGCGAGRLAHLLEAVTEHYSGMDISPHMLAECRNAMPSLTFLQGDMRHLEAFGDGEMDTVIAVSNLLDAVSHEDRLQTLAEVHRVLAPGGLFVFSAHNRRCDPGHHAPHLERSRNPITQLRRMADYVHDVANHLRFRRLERSESEYALFNDDAHHYSLLHYYIDRDTQARQLRAVGFELVESLDTMGRALRETDDDRAYASIEYVARRNGSAQS
jgi:ubiquinone/menaquinone biosynthesis C-methylase UbiE